MAEYKVTLTETHTYEVLVDMPDPDSAKDIVYQSWENGELGYAGLDIEIELEVA